MACEIEESEPDFALRANYACEGEYLLTPENFTQANAEDLTDAAILRSDDISLPIIGVVACELTCSCLYDPAEPTCANGEAPDAIFGFERPFFRDLVTPAFEWEIDIDDCGGLAQAQDEVALALCWEACVSRPAELAHMACCIHVTESPFLADCLDGQGNIVPCAAIGGSTSAPGSGSGSGSGSG